ncbi:hypothetical protein GPECTOR_42g852 [Gonium pectorale]|uniref:ShKT domain-containing protein n=1 Tax=Gonium pectorale TaxID=33097 RepID=A0A150G9X7_GONPE|nr:hypothetical protein GPECTOR_42g852 [Gonium pectorale]|eukprot:KXZ46641.1 hypothetical protein GPECTOR_42g852 [Gonium pectorale]
MVATSLYRDEYENQNEVAAVQSVSSDGRTVVLQSALQYPHYGGPEYQTEVGLLSRSILLQSWPGAASTRTGGHVKIMGQGRLEGVLSYRMGQRNVLGAYPFHWHNAGNAQGVSYARDCAVFNSFYRCFVIHGTNNLVLTDNVAFHVDGSCFYLEDGVEEGNWLQRNLGAFVHVIGLPAGGVTQSGETFVQGPNLAHPADAAAGVFYAANPNNAFKDNAASGGFAGFNFPVLPEPIGDHRWMRTTLNPSRRPLKLFDGNTAHSSGYFWIMAGGIYVGGKLWVNDADGGKLYYSSGRYEMDTRDDTGTQLAFQNFTNNKVWLAQWGISHWGARVRVVGWEAHDCTRGANIFGLALLGNALVNGRSANADAQYPAGDHDPIAGFRWYDTRVMTILSNVTFSNYAYQPELGAGRQSVWFSMVHSDEFKPAYISASRGIAYRNVDGRALVNNPPVDTGAGRYFNWIDHDGSATLRGKPSLVTSWPAWWNLGPDCAWQPTGDVYWCDYLPWRAVARLEVRVPGWTVPVDSGNAFPPDPAYRLGYVAQFGRRGSDTRNMTVTRNEGITGASGTTGWYLHLSQGATPVLQVFLTQVPPGTSLVFATRYPPGTTFSVSRVFAWYPALSSALAPAANLGEVLAGAGDRYWFSGKHLYVKIVDPGDASVDPPFSAGGATVWGTRYFSAWYWINVTRMGGQDPYAACPWVWGGGNPLSPGARFCPLADDPASDIPDALPTTYNSWVEPFCTDVAPQGTGGDTPSAPASAANAAGGAPSVTANAASNAVTNAPAASSDAATNVAASTPASTLSSATHVTASAANATNVTAFAANASTDTPASAACSANVPANANAARDSPPAADQLLPAGIPDLRLPPLLALPPLTSLMQQLLQQTQTQAQQKQPSPGVAPPPVVAAAAPPAFPAPPATSGSSSQRQSPSPPPPAPPTPPLSAYMAPSSAPSATGSSSSTATGGTLTCAQVVSQGLCGSEGVRRPTDPHVRLIGGYCAVSCGVCAQGERACMDKVPPGGLTCAQRRAAGNCAADWVRLGAWCAATCGACTPADPLPPLPPAPACSDVRVPPGTYSCAQQLDWGQCAQPWMKLNGWCLASCGLCEAGSPAPSPPAPAPAPPGCVDVAPPGGYTCAQQASWGKCSADFMTANNYCAATCRRCGGGGTGGGGASCGDLTPPGGYTCAQQASWGRCGDGFMLPYGYCAVTCGRCGGGGACYDVAPSAGYSCAQQKAWGKCGDSFMMLGGYCATACGRCAAIAAATKSGVAAAAAGTVGTTAAVADGAPTPSAPEAAAGTAFPSGGVSGSGKVTLGPLGAGQPPPPLVTPFASKALAAAAAAALPAATPAAGAVNAGAVNAGAVNAGAVNAGAVNAGAVNAGAVNAGAVNASKAVGATPVNATALPGAEPYIINPLGAPSPYASSTVAAATGTNGTAAQRYGSNATYAPYQTAQLVSAAASISSPEFAADTAAARAAAAIAAAAGPPNGGGGNGANASTTTAGGVPATKGGGATSIPSVAPNKTSAASLAVAAPAVAAASPATQSAATVSAASVDLASLLSAANPTFEEAFNPFENTTSVRSPGAPLSAAKPGFYAAWARSAALATAGYDFGPLPGGGFGGFGGASVEGDVPATSAGGGGSTGGGGGAASASFHGLPISLGYIGGGAINRTGAIAAGSFGAAEVVSGSGGAAAPACAVCGDVAPTGGRLRCADVASRGLCNVSWVLGSGYCDGTCGRCPYSAVQPCTDVLPASYGNFSGCGVLRAAGGCRDELVRAAGWCRATCGNCTAPPPAAAVSALAVAPPTDGGAVGGNTSTSAMSAAAAVAGGAGGVCWTGECSDLPPPGSQQDCSASVRASQCADPWFSGQGYCDRSCGRCRSA